MSSIDWEDLTGVLATPAAQAAGAARRRPWEDHRVLARGAAPARAAITPWADRAEALAGTASGRTLDLGGTWRALTCVRPEAVPADAADPACDDAAWPTLRVPGHPELQGRDIPIYTNIQYPFAPTPPTVPDANPTTVYRRRFAVPADWADRPLALEFAGTDPWFRLWLDGRELGLFAAGSRNPASFELPAGLAAGEHLLTVVVPRWAWTTYIEDQDQWWLSGIFRPVRLVLLDAARPLDWAISAAADGRLAWQVETVGCAGRTLRAELFDGDAPVAGATAVVGADGAAELLLRVPGVRPWSAETPHLYRAVLRIDGSPAWYGQPVGFRDVELRDGRLLVNGNAVKLRGVNRHDAHPVLGRAVGPAEIAADLRLIKSHGFNAVRTSHYPPQDVFFDLCDAYGLYVLAEADVETHGMRDALARDPSWQAAFVDRAERLVRRQRSRACIIAWSLGNESGMGPNIEAAAAAVRACDPGRPVQYHHGGTHACLDWVTMHYPRLDEVRALLADPAVAGRGVLLEEYAHAMGNAVGNLAAYEALIDSEPRLLGGFIWEWSDHGLWQEREGGRRLAYGGDFGDSPNDGNFCIDGICSAERRIKPALAECGQVYAPLAVRRDDAGRIVLRSRRFHADCADLRLIVRLLADGRVLREETVPTPVLPPGAEAVLALPSGFVEPPVAREALIEIEAVTRADCLWADAGHRLGIWQLETPMLAPAPLATTATLADGLRLAAAGVELRFDADDARLLGIEVLGRRLVSEVPGLVLTRARLDNDAPFAAAWREARFDRLQRSPVECRMDGSGIVLAARWCAPGGVLVASEEQRWSLDTAGRIGLGVRVVPAPGLPTLPRLGLRLRLDSSLATATWYGRGPHENLIDRCTAAPLGVHRCAVDDLAEPYVKPQESGQRTGVRWWHLGGSDGSGLAVFGDGGLTVCARRCAVEDLASAGHQEDVPRRPWIELILDRAHAGTGNTSLRAERLPWAQVPAVETAWNMVLDACSAVEAARRWPRLVSRAPAP